VFVCVYCCSVKLPTARLDFWEKQWVLVHKCGHFTSNFNKIDTNGGYINKFSFSVTYFVQKHHSFTEIQFLLSNVMTPPFFFYKYGQRNTDLLLLYQITKPNCELIFSEKMMKSRMRMKKELGLLDMKLHLWVGVF
jgi:hypothetical protein